MLPSSPAARDAGRPSSNRRKASLMTLSLAHQAVRAVVVAGSFMITAGAVGAPRSVAEFTLQRQESQPKWIPEGKPLFGDYLGSGDGSGSGALVGRIDWDLYEDQSRDD